MLKKVFSWSSYQYFEHLKETYRLCFDTTNAQNVLFSDYCFSCLYILKFHDRNHGNYSSIKTRKNLRINTSSMLIGILDSKTFWDCHNSSTSTKILPLIKIDAYCRNMKSNYSMSSSTHPPVYNIIPPGSSKRDLLFPHIVLYPILLWKVNS